MPRQPRLHRVARGGGGLAVTGDNFTQVDINDIPELLRLVLLGILNAPIQGDDRDRHD